MNTTHPRIQAASEFAHTHTRQAVGRSNTRVAPHPLALAQTGYYGRIDEDGRIRTTKIHVHIAGEHGPACGARLHPLMAFHFCSSGARSYVDCERCERTVELLSATS